MSWLASLVVGIVQGVTEWLPLSSDGMTSLIMVRFLDQPLSKAVVMAVWLHTGTVVAAAFYFRKELALLIGNLPAYLHRLLRKEAATPKDKLTSFIIVATACSGVVGLPLWLLSVEKAQFSGDVAMASVGGLLVLTGLFQLAARRRAKREVRTSLLDAVLVGSLQGLAVLPGLSRSGLTTSLLLFRGYDGAQAFRLSYLMSVPAILAAEVGLGLLEPVPVNISSLVGVAASFLLGVATIHLLMRLAQRLNFGLFCIFLGTLAMLPLLL